MTHDVVDVVHESHEIVVTGCLFFVGHFRRALISVTKQLFFLVYIFRSGVVDAVSSGVVAAVNFRNC